MTDLSSAQTWFMRAGFLGLGLAILFFQLLPLETVPRSFAGPDLLIAFTFAWALRRPDFVPVLLVAAVLLLSDLLLQRPPGLWAVLAVLATQALKKREPGLRDQTFAVEWLTVGITLLILMLCYRLTLAVLLIPQAPLGLTVIQTVATIIAYPLVAALTNYVFGVRKLQPGDLDASGART
ncbi:rod shape-determining protein MreD [Thalassovita sp.]|uniref:rod shape-determining protein MreD n=1 Tax=Thalassovita sp. TaxID=1979401 RepID=UPI0029DE6A0F|nr:rod shape-determining protein MreD [Thalassovita sp.]